MNKPRVFVTHSDIPQKGALDLLSERCELVFYPGKKELTREQILEGVKGVDVILWCTKFSADKEVLDAAGPNLKVFVTVSSGYDKVDVTLMKSRGIKVGNTPNVVNNCVAECALALMLAAARRMTEGRQIIQDSQWPTTFSPIWMLGHEICGSVIGIVGLGGIGQAIARRLQPFEPTKIIYTGHAAKPEGDKLGASFTSFDELLQQSDFVVVACPLNEETKEMFNDAAFRKMKRNAIFVNVGRGGVVNQPALVRALETGTIWAAGLDVTSPEPLPADDPLMKLSNAVVIPHLGTATMKTRTAMAKLAAQNVLAALDGKPMPAPL